MRFDKLLFVIQTRTATSRPTERPLTDQERLEGWYDGAEHDWSEYKDRQSNEGHERGRLHSMPEGQILTWAPAAGDRILAALKVSFKMRFVPAAGPDDRDSYELIAAKLTRAIAGPMPDYHRRFVFCDSVLGRPVMLGEDGAEDAFGQDEIVRTLTAALDDNDWRPAQCSYRLEAEPAELAGRNSPEGWAAYRRFADVTVQKSEGGVLS